jgi:peroxiredoxin
VDRLKERIAKQRECVKHETRGACIFIENLVVVLYFFPKTVFKCSEEHKAIVEKKQEIQDNVDYFVQLQKLEASGKTYLQWDDNSIVY